MNPFRVICAACAMAFACAPSSPAAEMPRPSFHTVGSPTGKPRGPLQPGEYWWAPVVCPSGPVVVVVSVPLQVLHVYRNGILVGRSSVSTGTKGHATPAGVFSILEKKQTHRSKTYNNAPMPNMQRLTWSGIAMHSGQLPGYPASHGCIRMPYDFSKHLFALTDKGGTVVIGDGKSNQPHLASDPGILLAPKDLSPEMLRTLREGEYDWHPERSPAGPIAVLISGADRMVYVYRNGNPIGRAPIAVGGSGPLGGHVFSLLEGSTSKPSAWSPDRPERRWMCVASNDQGLKISPESLARRIRVNPDFATKVYDILTPGASLIVTDEPAVRKPNRDFAILTN